MALQFASPKLQDNINIVYSAIEEDARSLKYASDKIALEIIKKNGMALEFVSDILKNDIDTVYIAIAGNPNAIQYASKQLQELLQ